MRSNKSNKRLHLDHEIYSVPKLMWGWCCLLMMMMKYLLNSRKQHHGEIGDWCKSTWLNSRHLSPIHTLIHSFQHSCLHTYVEQAVIWSVGTRTHTHTHARTHMHTLAHKTRFIATLCRHVSNRRTWKSARPPRPGAASRHHPDHPGWRLEKEGEGQNLWELLMYFWKQRATSRPLVRLSSSPFKSIFNDS